MKAQVITEQVGLFDSIFEMKNYNNYLYTKKLNLDIEKIKSSSIIFHKYLLDNFISDGNGYNAKSTATTEIYNQYNLFLYGLPGYYDLFNEIRNVYRECSQSNKNVYIQSWLNVYHKNQFIDWHRHWKSGLDVWHGFYCVNTEPNSFTSYKLPHFDDIINIDSQDDLLVIGKSDGDKHRSSDWQYDYPRVTIAFDIVPEEHINFFINKNHWIPLL